MFKRHYRVDLLSDVAITADAATIGGHRGLDYLRGSIFLGAAVASSMKDGGDFSPELFLSGKVRFLNAYPLADGLPAFPFPLCFHKVKGEEWKGARPWNSLTDEHLTGGRQPKQWRSGYLSTKGQVVEIPMEHRMKTAVDRGSRRSQEGQLFGYQSIPKGTSFLWTLQADEKDDLEMVHRWLTEAPVYLGRSKGAEYGSVRISAVEPVGAENSPPVRHPEDLVVLYLLSDLALSRDGLPVLLPEGRDFGLEGVKLDWERSSIKVDRYAPWNGFFNSRMTERQIISKGSVLVFSPDPKNGGTVDLEELSSRLSRGVGLFTEEGMGQILVNPRWVLEPPELKAGTDPSSDRPSQPDTPLVRFLKRKTDRAEFSDEALITARKWAKSWYSLAKKLLGDGQEVPSKAQWGTVRQLSLRFMDRPGDLMKELEKFCTEDLRKKAWEGSIYVSGRNLSLYQALIESMTKKPDERSCLALHLAAIEMGRMMSRSDNEKEVR
ncbi:hypothetical protein [Dethiosulfovibrio salsuginis]|uniref:CRISPR-associated protein Csx10 n=1 Tax=Dethiosulfovibrio salsuginis TaxID=561720 RepID=A0A1X7KUR3_9BACT|nr:hypothetical protein [Dethiosulfovibrio salsuginis]SMG45172.1 hypothetical protein SAMN06275492_1376 [Dethiosulfovibrio salsuginis]